MRYLLLCLRVPVVRCLSVRPLTPIARDAISLYLVEEFQRKLAQIFTTPVGISEKVFGITGSKVKVICVQMCECYDVGGIHISGMAPRHTRIVPI